MVDTFFVIYFLATAAQTGGAALAILIPACVAAVVIVRFRPQWRDGALIAAQGAVITLVFLSAIAYWLNGTWSFGLFAAVWLLGIVATLAFFAWWRGIRLPLIAFAIVVSAFLAIYTPAWLGPRDELSSAAPLTAIDASLLFTVIWLNTISAVLAASGRRTVRPPETLVGRNDPARAA